MRSFIVFTILNFCLVSQASEIREAEQQRSNAESQLQLLKQDSQLDAKKKKVIESELQRLARETKILTQKIKIAEQNLKQLRMQQLTSKRAIQETRVKLKFIVQHYRNELIAYYTSGRTLKPHITDEGTLSDYLPFILDARKQRAEIILDKTQKLDELLSNQIKNKRAQQETLNNLNDSKQLLQKKTQDSQNVLVSINRDLSTHAKRKSALQSDLKSLERRVKQIQLDRKNSAFAPIKGQLIWPTNGRVLRRFGQVRKDGFGDWQGMVISANEGSNVQAVQSGKVAYAGYLLGYGLVIVIAHNQKHATIYGHNQSLLVHTGNFVNARQPIAIAGNTGSLDVTGVYFGLTQNGNPINPSAWLN